MLFRVVLILFSSAFFLLSSFRVYAQTQNHFSGWAALFGSFKLNNKFSIHFDGQVRSSDKWQEVQTVLIRPGLHYQVKKNQLATVGYAYVGHHRRIADVSGWGPEHRIWEQYIINQRFPVLERSSSFQHRFRLEQRFISKSVVSNNKLETDGHAFAQRLRYFARWVVPLKKTANFKQGTFVSLQDEVFVNIGDASGVNGKFFDQNRAYGSFGYRFSPKADLEVGYMNQFVAGRANNTSNNILQLAGYLRL
ncbi:MAG: DUF2490 domain-containing protein [Filimonas sp.]|nr:DUF2490 domain-containing protein [Filimonas sp.]